MQLSVIIPLHNPAHLESKIEKFLIPQLESFKRNTTLAGIEFVYVANGCTLKSLEVLNQYNDLPINVVWFDKGIGFTKATNEGIQAAKGDFILLFNDDAIILDYAPKDFWKNVLIKPFLEDPQVGITGVHELYCSHSEAFFFVGYCVMCRRTLLEKIGTLDEIFSPGAGEDTDLCIRARLHGWRTHLVKTHGGGPLNAGDFTYPIWHPAESTFHNWEAPNDYAEGSKWDKVFKRNSQTLANRRKSGYYDFVNPIPDTVPILRSLIKSRF